MLCRYGCVGALYKNWIIQKNDYHMKNFMEWRMFIAWRDTCRRTNANRESMEGTLRMVAMRHERAALAAWHDAVVSRQRQLDVMERALRGVVMSRELVCFNMWHEQAEAKRAKKAKLKACFARVSPEGRAMMHFIEKLKGIMVEVRGQMHAPFLSIPWCHVACSPHLVFMVPRAVFVARLISSGATCQVRRMRSVLAGFADHGLLHAWNKWRANMAEKEARDAHLQMVVARISPEGRAKLNAIEHFQQCAPDGH